MVGQKLYGVIRIAMTMLIMIYYNMLHLSFQGIFLKKHVSLGK